MKKPEDIPEALVEKVVRAKYAREREEMRQQSGVNWSDYDTVIASSPNWFDDDIRDVREHLALAWDDIYADGYTDGFQDQEGMEIQAEVLKQGEWAPRIFIWMDGANEEQAEAVLDTITDYAHENEPDGVTLTMGAVLAPGKRNFPTRGVSTN